MANRYWVGKIGGYWADTNNWSVSSNGSGGASVPTSSDNVYFDAYSFSSTGCQVIISSSANCKDINWTGLNRSGTRFTLSSTLNVYGNITLNSNMYMTGTANINLNGTYSTINTNGVSITAQLYLTSGGGYTLLNNLSAYRIYFINGYINTGNYSITCTDINLDGTATKQLVLGSSTITCSRNFTIDATNTTLDAGTSKLIMTGTSTCSLSINGLILYNVELQSSLISITSSGTYNDLKITAGKTVTITAGTTQTISTLSNNGTPDSLITLCSSASGSTYTLSKSSGVIDVKFYSIQDCIVTGDATFNARFSIDGTGNTGWTFNTYPLPITSTERTSINTLLAIVQDTKAKLINAMNAIKITTFYQGSIPISKSVGDYWVNTDDNNHSYRAAIVGANEIKTGEWESVRDTDAVSQSSSYNDCTITTANGFKASHANGGYTQLKGDGLKRWVPIPQYTSTPTGVPNVENFDTGVLSDDWEVLNSAISSTQYHNGSYSLKIGSGDNVGYARIDKEITVTPSTENVSFYYYFEGNAGSAHFRVDGEYMGSIIRDATWHQITTTVSKGMHVFQWYVEEVSSSEWKNLYIDEIIFEQNPVEYTISDYINSGYSYNYRTYIGNTETIGAYDGSGYYVSPIWIQLPEDFKGQNFNVFLSLKDTNIITNYGISQIILDTIEFDYTNGRFKVKAYAIGVYTGYMTYLVSTWGIEFTYFAVY